MSRIRSLVVWLHGESLAELTEPRSFSYRLTFSEQANKDYGRGARPLSLSLPIAERHQGEAVRNFLNGLLPEGQIRTEIARDLGVPQNDLMRLLNAVGKDCAGAVQVLPEGHTPGEGFIEPVSGEDLAAAIASLPLRSAGGLMQQASLGGIQDKLLVARTEDGGWGWPREGAASTHIIKPQPGPGFLNHLVRSEAWALEVARAAGVAAAEGHVQVFDERDAIVVERYDRANGGRIHQEDFCQALGLDVNDKYESGDGGRLVKIAKLVGPRAKNEREFRASLLRAVTFNAAIGNGDAHSKNYSLLLHPHGTVELAPLYDVAPTWFMNPNINGTGHRINGQAILDKVTVDDLVAEAASWGMPATTARQVVHEVVERTVAAAKSVPAPPGLEQLPAKLASAPLARETASHR